MIIVAYVSRFPGAPPFFLSLLIYSTSERLQNSKVRVLLQSLHLLEYNMAVVFDILKESDLEAAIAIEQAGKISLPDHITP